MTFEDWWEDLSKLPMNEDAHVRLVAQQAWKAAWGEATKELNKLLENLNKAGKIQIHKVQLRKRNDF